MNKNRIVVFDIDGTLAHCSARVNHMMEKPKNWDAFLKRKKGLQAFS